MSLATWVSTLGVSLLLAAYLGSATRKMSQDSLVYWVLNLLGGSLAAVGAAMIGSLPFVVLESAWVAASLVGLVKFLRNKKPSKND